MNCQVNPEHQRHHYDTKKKSPLHKINQIAQQIARVAFEEGQQ